MYGSGDHSRKCLLLPVAAIVGIMSQVADALGPLLLAIVNEPPPDLRSLRPDLPEPVVAIVERALHKSPDARYQSAADMTSALRSATGLSG